MKVATVAVCIVALSFSSAPGAGIVLGSCIGRLGLWDRSTEVLRQWGKPIRRDADGPYAIWHYRTGEVVLIPWRDPPHQLIVLELMTRSPAERTPAGLGVGTSAAVLDRALPGAGCRIRQGQYATSTRRGVRHSTYFRLQNSRVTEVRVLMESSYDDGSLHAADRRCRPK